MKNTFCTYNVIHDVIPCENKLTAWLAGCDCQSLKLIANRLSAALQSVFNHLYPKIIDCLLSLHLCDFYDKYCITFLRLKYFRMACVDDSFFFVMEWHEKIVFGNELVS